MAGHCPRNSRVAVGSGGRGRFGGDRAVQPGEQNTCGGGKPPAGPFINVDGARIHYVDRGSGPVVVLLHGNGVTLQDFEAGGVLALVGEQYRVIAFDRPGFGYSERPRTTIWTPAAQARLLATALRALAVGPAVIVGHSWGTLVALAIALDEAGSVSGLLLLSGYHYGTGRPDVWPLSAPAVRATAADTAMMVPAAIQLSRRYEALAVPVIVMAGEGDLIAHADTHAERFAREVPGAELRIVPDQGHLFHYYVPEQVVAAIGDAARRASA